MNRRPRVARRPDHWSTPHARARVRAAERLTRPLRADEAAWLTAHLDGCEACSSIAAAYERDRLALRALRDVHPEPPRDLWARTAAAIERESAARFGSDGAARRSGWRLPIGALSAFAVIAVVVGLSAVSSGLLGGPSRVALAPVTSDAGGSAATESPLTAEAMTPDATPLTVRPGDVEWLDTSGGQLAYNNASISEVCPVDDTADCGPLAESGSRVSIAAVPRTIIGSPTDGQAVAVGQDAAGGDQLMLVALPSAGPATQSSAPAATPGASETLSIATPPPTPMAATPSSGPPASSAPSSAPPESAAPTTASPEPTPSATPSTPSSSPTPSTPPPPTPNETATPTLVPDVTASPTKEPSAGPSAEPTATVIPTADATAPIAEGVEILGGTAAFSADGHWFAFTARPSGGSAGPDIYVWRVGDAKARPVTTDGTSVFASWDGDRVVGSRPRTAAATGGGFDTSSFIVDPLTGAETTVARPVWQPVVDPTGRRAVAWVGTVAPDAGREEWHPANGAFQLIPWGDAAKRAPDEAPVAIPVADPPADFDVRWDESGEWFAIWIADASDPAIGHLSLYRIDRATGDLEVPDSGLTELAALPGFSIGEGRMAWATPPGQGGEGSRVQVVAWKGDEVGTVEAAPGEDIVVVR